METALLRLIVFLITAFSANANPRADIIARICSEIQAQNALNYIDTYSKIVTQMKDEMPKAKFAFNEAGKPPDKVYVLAQCMDDLSGRDCQTCFSEINSLLSGCFPSTGGRVYLDGCFLRGDNYSFFEETDSLSDFSRCSDNMDSDQIFIDSAKRVIEELVRKAPSQDGYAACDESRSGFSVYGMASCWKTLDHDLCAACLADAALSAFACLPSIEGRVLKAGCFLRYSDYEFANDIHSQSARDAALVFGAHVLGVICICALAITIGFYVGKATYRKRNQQRGTNEIQLDSSVVRRSLQFKYATLEKATDHFSAAQKLGQGGFGEVFKGTLPDGREIAIKRLCISGNCRTEEIYNEMDIISRAYHKNLVQFLGSCFTNTDSFLVYEFLVNRSLDGVLFVIATNLYQLCLDNMLKTFSYPWKKDPEKKQELDWKRRLGIIMGTGQGLEYLHKDCYVQIIHRDIKASNILLDIKYKPKIADFGLARLCSNDRGPSSTAIAGTLGYMAPEYLAQGRLTEKVDVYSYGVLVLEIVSGTRNNKFQIDDTLNTLVTATWHHFQSNTASEIIDQSMEIEDMEEVTRVIQVGLLCTQESPSVRPTMTEIIQMLKQKDSLLPIPSKPPFTQENLTISPTLGSPRRQPLSASDLCISCNSDTEHR